MSEDFCRLEWPERPRIKRFESVTACQISQRVSVELSPFAFDRWENVGKGRVLASEGGPPFVKN
jgi:hypothetical protein